MAQKPPEPLQAPKDLARRQEIMGELTRTPSATPPPADQPDLSGYSEGVRRAVTAPEEAFNQSARNLVKGQMVLDVPQDVTPEVIKQLVIPQAANATSTADSQADAVQFAGGEEVAKDLPLSPAEVRDLVSKHGAYMSAATGTKVFLRGIDAGRAANAAVRHDKQEAARAWVKAKIASLPEGDPRRTELQARYGPIEALEKKDQTRQDQIAQKGQQDREQLIEQIDTTQSEYELAQVVDQLRADQVPDYDALLQAARYLRQKQAETQAGGTPAPGGKPGKGGRRPPATPAVRRGQPR